MRHDADSLRSAQPGRVGLPRVRLMADGGGRRDRRPAEDCRMKPQPTPQAPAQDPEGGKSSWLERFVDASFWNSRIVTGLVTLIALFMLYFVFTVPLAFSQQLTFAACCFAVALLFRRMESRYATMVMIMLSI